MVRAYPYMHIRRGYGCPRLKIEYLGRVIEAHHDTHVHTTGQSSHFEC
jgi:hypothetical protein